MQGCLMPNVRWKLREIMARYKITNVKLAEKLEITKTAVSDLRTSDTFPRIDGGRLANIAKALSDLSGAKISIFDLMEEIEDD